MILRTIDFVYVGDFTEIPLTYHGDKRVIDFPIGTIFVAKRFPVNDKIYYELSEQSPSFYTRGYVIGIMNEETVKQKFEII